jgi:ribokinase
MANQKPIVVIGSINIDLVCRAARRPAPGETLLGRDFAIMPGGKGANQAVAAARLGAEVHLIGRVGDDEFGRDLLAGLQHNSVRTNHVSITPGISSGVALIVVDDSGENSIVVVPGANARLMPADIDAAIAIISNAACVILQLETPYATVEHAIGLCRRLGVHTILDPAPAPAGVMPAAFYQADLLTPNQSEARAILGAGSESLDDGSVGRSLLDRGVKCVVLKLGNRGAMILTATGVAQSVPSFPVTAVDTTAAGDAFTAALAVGFSERMGLSTAVKFANAAGASACIVAGAQPSLPTRAEVDAICAGKIMRSGPIATASNELAAESPTPSEN